MSLHNDIMNLQVDPSIEQLPAETRITYKNGHKVARHAAAELSLKYERALGDALFEFSQLAEMAQDSFVRVWAEQRIAQIKEILEEI